MLRRVALECFSLIRLELQIATAASRARGPRLDEAIFAGPGPVGSTSTRVPLELSVSTGDRPAARPKAITASIARDSMSRLDSLSEPWGVVMRK